MQKLYAALCPEGGRIRSPKVTVQRIFVRGSEFEATVLDERKRTRGEYRITFDGQNLTCSCGKESCDHLDKVVTSVSRLTHYKRSFIDPEAEYLYVRNRQSVYRINLKEIGLEKALKNLYLPYKNGYSKTRVRTNCESVGVEYETYGPRNGWYEEYNAVVNALVERGWRYEHDASIPASGGELKSPPIEFAPEPINLLVKRLETVRLLSKHGEYSGFHVHVSFPEQLDHDTLEGFYAEFAQQLKNIERYVDLSKLFGRGFNRYSSRLGNYIIRYCWLNLENLKSNVPTLEVRGGSTKAKSYKDIIMFTIAMKDLTYGYYRSFKDKTSYHTNPFLYVRKELLKYIEPYTVPEAKLLLWQAYMRREG